MRVDERSKGLRGANANADVSNQPAARPQVNSNARSTSTTDAVAEPRTSPSTKQGPATPQSPTPGAVTPLLESHGAEAPKRAGWRILSWVAAVETDLGTKGAAEYLATYAGAARVRTVVFRLESLLRFAHERFGEPMTRRRERTKALEDALGRVGYAADMAKHAKRAGVSDAEGYWEGMLTQRRAELDGLLSTRWLPGAKEPEIAKLVRDVAATEWGGAKAERRALIEGLIWQADRIADSKLDMSDLQGGLHELRRQLRWIPITCAASNGAVVLTDERVPKRWSAMLADPQAASPFAQLDADPGELAPVVVPRVLYIALNKLIEDLGKIKDDGEAIEGLALALQATRGLSPKAAHHEAAAALGISKERQQSNVKRARALYAEAKDVTAALIDDLRRQLKA